MKRVRKKKRILSRFRAFRARGEWFYATPRIMQYIEKYAVQHTELLTEDIPPKTVDSSEALFGKQLAKRRNAANMTQDDLAARVGCSRGFISFLENNRGTPGQHLQEKLVEILGEFLESNTETRGHALESNNVLAVELEDGHWISEDTGIDTFIEVIKTLGVEKVKNLGLSLNGIPLVSDCDYPDKAQRKIETETAIYYIVSGTNTESKKKNTGRHC